MTRRLFLTLPSLALAQTGPRIGLDGYSVRAYRWKALELVDYAARIGARTLQISSLGDFESLEPAYLERVKQAAQAKGVELDAGIGCICPLAGGWRAEDGDPAAYLTKGLRVAKAIGASAMRCYLGNINDRRKYPVEQLVEAPLKGLRAVRAVAQDLGVKVAIENHGDLSARETRRLIEDAGAGHVGACLDIGNPLWVLEDPLLTVEVLAPYIASTHLRDSALYAHSRGAAFQWLALGDGTMPVREIFTKIQQVAPRAPLHLEIITGRPPQVLPYHEEALWKDFRNLPAADFARFATLVKNGRPYEGGMIIADIPGGPAAPPEYQAALKLQQRLDLERSLAFARKMMA
ncbi:MAG: sugar phosphate isomerase/epimerase [Bryobacteraceae bacterium]|nr:sugar phosphate isomerase/epimerase [Bryobacteraceae bacterium]